MPEPTPTTDVVGEERGKKLPKWALIAIIGGGVFALLYYKHLRAKQEEQKGFVEAQTGGQNLEQSLPSSGGELVSAAQALQKQNTEFLEKSLHESEKESNAPKPVKTRKGGRQGSGTQITGTKGSTHQEEPFKPSEKDKTQKEQAEKRFKENKEKVYKPLTRTGRQ